VTAATKKVLETGMIDAKRVGLIGHSWGGHLALQLAVAAMAWWMSGDPIRFLSVVVVATACSTCGSFSVYIGSKLIGTVNLHSTALTYQAQYALPVELPPTRAWNITAGSIQSTHGEAQRAVPMRPPAAVNKLAAT
jgi:pimeloyl-ACP methyl ester carboxylesterase